MDKPQMKTETDLSDASPDAQMESEAAPDDISQQDQNAQLFIEALLQASQNQLLTESAVLAMNQLWMGSRGALAQSGQGNISLAGPGNVSVITPGNVQLTGSPLPSLSGPGSGSLAGSGNLQFSGDRLMFPKSDEHTSDQANIVLDSHGNIQVSGHGNLQIGNHGNIQSGSLGNEQLGSVANTTQVGQINILQPGLSRVLQLTNPHPLQGENSENQKEVQIQDSRPVKDSHIKQALPAPVRISQIGKVIASSDSQVKVITSSESGVKVRQMGSKVSEVTLLPSNDLSDTVESDCSISDGPETGKQPFSGKVELYTDTVVDLMDTSEGTGSDLTRSDSGNVSSTTVQTSFQNVQKSTSPPASSPKKKSRRQSSSTSHVTDGSITPSGGARSQLVQEKSGSETGNRATTPRRKGSHLSEGGRRSRPLSECEGDLTPDASSHLPGYSSDDMRRQMAGSVTPDTDLGFQPSMLEAVLTEKKLALLRSPEVRQFLQQQQLQRARERKLTHSSRGSCSKGDNST